MPDAERARWERGGASFAPDAIDTNAIRAADAFTDLIARSLGGDAAVADRLGVDPIQIDSLVREKCLYAFSHGETQYFPAWQFGHGGTLPGLRQVVSILGDRLHPLVVDHWFRTPSVDLEIGQTPVSPATWLARGGDPSAVVELAADL